MPASIQASLCSSPSESLDQSEINAYFGSHELQAVSRRQFLLIFWISRTLIHEVPLSETGWASFVPLRCPLAWLFHIQCPTCGLGRSLVTALGHWQTSWHYHPFGLPLFWGSQGLLLTWILRPQTWSSLHAKWLGWIAHHPILLWLGMLAYSVWGFAFRNPV